MHPNPQYRRESRDHNLAYARERGFGVLSVNGDAGPMMAHVPFVISDDSRFLDMHLVRSNPIARMIEDGAGAAMAVSGPDAYVSPDWYGDTAQVPTWNYVAVHLRGTLAKRDVADLGAHLAELSAHFEAGLLPKPPWTMDKTPDDALEKMMRMLVPMRLTIDSIEGTWKLNQNKTPEQRRGAIKGLKTSPIGQELAMLRALMQGVPGTDIEDKT